MKTTIKFDFGLVKDHQLKDGVLDKCSPGMCSIFGNPWTRLSAKTQMDTRRRKDILIEQMVMNGLAYHLRIHLSLAIGILHTTNYTNGKEKKYGELAEESLILHTYTWPRSWLEGAERSYDSYHNGPIKTNPVFTGI